MASLFVADVHLSRSRPAQVAAFLALLDGYARRADAVFLLGDVFDLWLGDDDLDPPNGEAMAAIGRLARAGVPVYAQHGNHDFLLGEGFAAATGCRLLPDPVVAHLDGERVLLSHGDGFCTDDEAYQRWRAFTRDPRAQAVFRRVPLVLRRAYASYVRRRSRAETGRKPKAIMDVNPAAVAAAMKAHGVRRLIHGHTHRPGFYPVDLGGVIGERVVLADWYATDSVLVWERSQCWFSRVADLPGEDR